MKKKILSHALVLAVGLTLGGVLGTHFQASRTASRIESMPVKTAQSEPTATARGTPAIASEKLPVEEPEISGPRLSLEDPETARSLAARDKRLIAWFKGINDPIYDKLFSSYGMDPAMKESVIAYIAKVYQAKIEARKYTTQLIEAQMIHERTMRVLLGEKYEEYAKFEAQRPVREESGYIANLFDKSGVLFSEDSRRKVEALVESNAAFSERTMSGLGGPYGEVPKQAYGTETVIAILEKQQATLSLKKDTLIEQARASGLSPQEIQVLTDYYEGQVSSYDQTIEKITPATPRKVASLEQQMDELRRNPATDPRQIQRVEAELNWMRQKLAAPGGG